ncbi:S-adenosyl-L-methionine-dependent methyltransferases superfamily protein [Tripterygium wilfordii]|uniref:S-adenosyl-L-methionine-dependent methyltransferases superfamily protein n=1 Tax=Tripterygium wilfordii TaxID=458696 RepID=A0A7J7E327_TRIWF|nr:S-adenosyl-L-methionine-dependent methyltransferases superfamily protein [Tripterygium wilfordii]
MVKKITLETVEEVYVETKPISIGIADLGCSSGPNTLSIIKDIVEAIEATSGRTVNNPSPEEGQIEREKLESYEVHFYAPSENEIEDEVRREGSFQLDRMENFELERDETDGLSYGTKYKRAFEMGQIGPVGRTTFPTEH